MSLELVSNFERPVPATCLSAPPRLRLVADSTPADAAAPVFAPVVSLATGAIAAAELLPDWPIQTSQAPAEVQLDSSIAAATLWPASTGLWLRVSADQFADRCFPARLGQTLRRAGLFTDRISLLLPETLAVRRGLDSVLWLSSVRDLGIGLVLDGFGAVHGSLAMLRRLPLTGIKIDAGLVATLPDDAEDAAMVRSAAQAARALGLDVTAGGVEQESQRAFLSSIGCQQGQGVLFATPLPAAELRGWACAQSRAAARISPPLVSPDP